MRPPSGGPEERHPRRHRRRASWLRVLALIGAFLAFLILEDRKRALGASSPAHEGFVAAQIVNVELSKPLHDIESSGDPTRIAPRYLRARVLVRLHGTPLGTMDCPFVGGRIAASELRARIADAFGDAIARHADQDGVVGGRDPQDFVGHEGACRAVPALPAPPPRVSVVVCTRERPDDLARCLDAIARLRYEDLEVVVVDNAPSTPRTREVVAAADDPRIRYTTEPAPGLSRARNHGVRVSRGQIVAFTDDDVRVNASWLEALVRGFSRTDRVGCVTGCVLSAELETEAQELFDAKAGWGSRYSPAAYDLSCASGDQLLPFRAGAVGAGASFAVSRAALQRVGGFDEALGVGTPSRGGEDLDYFSRVLLDGFVIAYEPSSVAWHYHRRTEEAIRRQMTGYGYGLAAYATKQLVSPRSRGEAVRRLVPALSRLLEISSGQVGDTRMPARLRVAEARGMVAGPVAYLKSRRQGSNGAG